MPLIGTMPVYNSSINCIARKTQIKYTAKSTRDKQSAPIWKRFNDTKTQTSSKYHHDRRGTGRIASAQRSCEISCPSASGMPLSIATASPHRQTNCLSKALPKSTKTESSFRFRATTSSCSAFQPSSQYMQSPNSHETLLSK